MKMRTMADAQRANARRNNDQSIYGDSNLGDHGWGGDFEYDVDPNFKMKWPDGYWERYDELKREAQTFSQAIALHMVVCLNGNYRVYALMPVGLGKSGPRFGPEARDRHAAWQAFLDTFMRIESVQIPYKTMKLPADFKMPQPVLMHARAVNPNLAIKASDMRAHDSFAKKASSTFSTPISETTTHTPTKGKKARKP